MDITKHIHNQTFKNVVVNNHLLRPGESVSITDPVVKLYKSKDVYLNFMDSLISRYLGSDEFTIYITDQHGLIKQANFADSTLFMSLDTCKSCLYMARDDTPIINPTVYLYNKVQSKASPKNKISRWENLKSFISNLRWN